MKNFIRIAFILALVANVNTYASNPNIDGGRKLMNEPTIDLYIFSNEKVDVKKVEGVYKESKRVRKLFTPRKKNLKKKYTIA